MRNNSGASYCTSGSSAYKVDTTNEITETNGKLDDCIIQYAEVNIQKSLIYIDSIKTTYSIAFYKGVEYGYTLTESYLKEMLDMENKEIYEKLLVSNDSLRREIKGDLNNLENKIIERFDKLDAKFDKLDTKFDSKIDKTNDFVTKIYGDTQTLTTKVDVIQVKVNDDKNKFRAYLPFIILGLIGVVQAIIAIVTLSK